MKFAISRTSRMFDEKSPPTKGAFRDQYVAIDRRTTDDPSKIPWAKGESAWWYAEGRNHRVVKKEICRDLDREGWFIEIDSLDELMALLDKEGQLVLRESWANDEILEIEIYDGWRE